MNTTPDPTPAPNGFQALLVHHRKGRFMSDLSEHLQTAILAVREHVAPVTLTITVKIEPATDGDAACLKIADKVNLKLPDPRKSSTIFYSNDDGALLRENPEQQTLDLKTVHKPEPAPLREAPAKTA